MVGLLEDAHAFGINFAQDAHAEAGTGEGMPPDKRVGQAKFVTHGAHFVFEELA